MFLFGLYMHRAILGVDWHEIKGLKITLQCDELLAALSKFINTVKDITDVVSFHIH